MDKRFWAIIVVIVLVFVGILIFHNNGNNNGGNGNSNAKPTNHVEGDLNSKVTLLEYGDYQCPVCENYYLAVKAVAAKYNDRVKFQFRNLPLAPNPHPLALEAARAAEAADMQGKFWQMHDLLYDAQDWNEWAIDPSTGATSSADPTSFFDNYAKQLGLNVAQFQKDFASSAVNNRIQADIAAFKKTGQDEATPTFFLNGKYISNAQLASFDSNGVINVAPTVANFSKFIDAALKSAQ